MITFCFIFCLLLPLGRSLKVCPSGFESIGEKCFDFTGISDNFVECAKICEEKNATLPCIESEEENQAIFDTANSKSDNYVFYWIGLYQTPETFFHAIDWNNWHKNGCNSSFRNWDKGEPNDRQMNQEACAGVRSSSPTWHDAGCWWEVPQCVCQHGGEPNNLLTDSHKTSLLKNRSKFRNTTGIIVIVCYIIVTLAVLGYSVYTFKNIKYFQQKRHQVVIIIASLVPLAVSLPFTSKLIENEKTSLVLLLLALFPAVYIVMNQAFSLLDSIVLAIAGVRGARKCWIKMLRPTLYSYSVLAFVVVFTRSQIRDKWMWDQFADMWFFAISDMILRTVSYVFIIFTIIYLILFFVLKKRNENGNRNNSKMWKITNQVPHAKCKNSRTDVDDHNLQQFKNAKRNHQIQTMSLYWAFLLALLVYFSFFLSEYRVLTIFLPFLMLFLVLLRDINEVEALARENFKRKPLHRESITCSGNTEQGERIYNSDGEDLGMAPPAPLIPPWLFASITAQGKKYQTDLPPEEWIITIHNFIRFLESCLGTQTWLALATAKCGEQNITMHDVNAHFVVPWTRGTGRSIALLSDSNPGKADLMISHSWSGSVKETLNATKTLITMHFLPKDSKLFFCTLSQYQADDKAPGGLLIQEQLQMDPFNQVINSRPKYGMYVIHTTKSEVYDRLWCVDEVRAARKANIEIAGIFDPNVWTLSTFNNLMTIETKNAKCSSKSDRESLTEKIVARGGFTKLDKVIHDFRKDAKRDLRMALTFESTFGTDITKYDTIAMPEESDAEDEFYNPIKNSAKSECRVLEIEENKESDAEDEFEC